MDRAITCDGSDPFFLNFMLIAPNYESVNGYILHFQKKAGRLQTCNRPLQITYED